MRHMRILYHARIEYTNLPPQIMDESHSYDMGDTIDRMMFYVRHYYSDHGYAATFDANALTYTVTRNNQPHATVRLVSSDDGIDLL
jgi:hypothetical protein